VYHPMSYMARRKVPQFPPEGESQDTRDEREARIRDMMERATRHRAQAVHHAEQANRLTQRADALKRNPPTRTRR
jgi:hypothetical protein